MHAQLAEAGDEDAVHGADASHHRRRVIVRGDAAHEDRCDRRPGDVAPESMRALLAAGADVVRLNAAHGDADVHTERAALGARDRGRARTASSACSSTCPARRCAPGPIADDEVELDAGQRAHADRRRRSSATTHRVSTTLPELARWVGPGDDVFLADGAIVLRVERDRRRRRRVRGRARRRAALAQGHARAARRSARRAVHRDRRGRAADGDRDQGRLRRAVVRAPARRRRGRAGPAAQARAPAAARRQDRDRGRARPPRRASSARPTRSWSPAATSASRSRPGACR